MPRATGAGVTEKLSFEEPKVILFVNLYIFVCLFSHPPPSRVCGGCQDALRDWLAGSLPPILRHRKWEEKKV